MLNWLNTGGKPQAPSVLGTGQLLLTAVAILAACVKDLSNRKAVVSHLGLGDSVNAFAIALMLFMTGAYAYINSLVLRGELTDFMRAEISRYSIYFLAVSLFIAAAGIAITDTSTSKTGAP